MADEERNEQQAEDRQRERVEPACIGHGQPEQGDRNGHEARAEDADRGPRAAAKRPKRRV